jgi:hypothetical protein
MVRCAIITCPEWKAAPPKTEPTWCGQANRIIFHHTAGHHPEISVPSTESPAEAVAYAKQIQHYHMTVNGWIDSGHNFLICRNGLILQGRWRTVSAIEQRKMVISAHCPGQNDQIGIEHEHLSGEQMPEEQQQASARLTAWIADQYGLTEVLDVEPHRKYFATDCPDVLVDYIPGITGLAEAILHAEGGSGV